MKKVFNEYLNDKIKLDKWQIIGVVCLVLTLSGIFGWVYEFFFYYLDGDMKEFYWQGGPIKIFFISILVTGILEYVSGFVIYHLFNGLRLWDYNTEIWNFGNIDGFVCLRSVVFFGVSALFLIYGMIPFCIYLSKVMNKKVFLTVSISIFSIIIIDELYNLIIGRAFNLPRAYDIYSDLGIKYHK